MSSKAEVLLTACLCKPLACRLGDGKIGMDEGFRKHRQLMKRQYFGQEPPARPGIF